LDFIELEVDLLTRMAQFDAAHMIWYIKLIVDLLG
jgi:hypothetical protein